jgi:ATP-dependent DNA ligase
VAGALAALPDETVIDGEIVAFDESGRPSFNLLQNYGSSNSAIVYYVFDVLILSGRYVMSEPLANRRALLRRNVLPKLRDPIRESPELNAALTDVVNAVRAQGLEGVVAKNLKSAYEPGRRSGAWRKMRVNKKQEFVIGGYTVSQKAFDALIFGYYQDGKLLYAGTPQIRKKANQKPARPLARLATKARYAKIAFFNVVF